jgi:hypothetical protein
MARRLSNIHLPPNRPSIPINWDLVDNYLVAGCPGTEIAGIIGCHPETLYDRCVQEKGICFSEYSAKKRSKGDGLLRAKQFSEALKGDRGMLIWLGKNRLGQKDNPQTQEEFSGQLAQLLDMLLKSGKDNDSDNSEKACQKG